MEVKNYSNWHINVVVKREGDGNEWLFIGFYGPRDHATWCVVGV